MCSSSVFYKKVRGCIFTSYKSPFGNQFNIMRHSTNIFGAPTMFLALFRILGCIREQDKVFGICGYLNVYFVTHE